MVRDIVVKQAAQAQVEDLSPHDFRRIVAVDLLDNDIELVTVQKVLGYANVQPIGQDDCRGERAKKKAVEALYGRMSPAYGNSARCTTQAHG